MTIEGGCGPTFEMPPGLGNSFEVWSVLSCTYRRRQRPKRPNVAPLEWIAELPHLEAKWIWADSLRTAFSGRWPSAHVAQTLHAWNTTTLALCSQSADLVADQQKSMPVVYCSAPWKRDLMLNTPNTTGRQTTLCRCTVQLIITAQSRVAALQLVSVLSSCLGGSEAHSYCASHKNWIRNIRFSIMNRPLSQ